MRNKMTDRVIISQLNNGLKENYNYYYDKLNNSYKTVKFYVKNDVCKPTTSVESFKIGYREQNVPIKNDKKLSDSINQKEQTSNVLNKIKYLTSKFSLYLIFLLCFCLLYFKLDTVFDYNYVDRQNVKALLVSTQTNNNVFIKHYKNTKTRRIKCLYTSLQD